MKISIKLRGFIPAKALDLADRQWVNGDLYIDQQGRALIAPHCEAEDIPCEDARVVDPRTICIQTNLTDSRGFPLYTHDLVRSGCHIFELVMGVYDEIFCLLQEDVAIAAHLFPDHSLQLVGNTFNLPYMFFDEC